MTIVTKTGRTLFYSGPVGYFLHHQHITISLMHISISIILFKNIYAILIAMAMILKCSRQCSNYIITVHYVQAFHDLPANPSPHIIFFTVHVLCSLIYRIRTVGTLLIRTVLPTKKNHCSFYHSNYGSMSELCSKFRLRAEQISSRPADFL